MRYEARGYWTSIDFESLWEKGRPEVSKTVLL